MSIVRQIEFKINEEVKILLRTDEKCKKLVPSTSMSVEIIVNENTTYEIENTLLEFLVDDFKRAIADGIERKLRLIPPLDPRLIGYLYNIETFNLYMDDSEREMQIPRGLLNQWFSNYILILAHKYVVWLYNKEGRILLQISPLYSNFENIKSIQVRKQFEYWLKGYNFIFETEFDITYAQDAFGRLTEFRDQISKYYNYEIDHL